MKTSMLKEYIDRVGIVTREEMIERTGVARHIMYAPFAALINERDVYMCRLAHGSITYLSRHLVFCMRAVMCEWDLSPNAQDLFDWLSEHEGSATGDLQEALSVEGIAFEEVLRELQLKMAIAPTQVLCAQEGQIVDFSAEADNGLLLWATADHWVEGLYKASRYTDFGYCLSEIRRLLNSHFSTREINDFIYRSVR